MTATSEQTDRAIARVSEQPSAAIRQVLENARRTSNNRLIKACEAELNARGSYEMTKQDVEQMLAATKRSADKAFVEVIEIAFTDVPAKPEEVLILRWISNNPGTTYALTAKIYGRNDLSLVIGHLIYYRFGYFRRFLKDPIQSNLLLTRDQSPEGVRYTLRFEAAGVLKTLGVV